MTPKIIHKHDTIKALNLELITVNMGDLGT